MNEQSIREYLSLNGTIKEKELRDGRWYSTFDSEKYDLYSCVTAYTKAEALLEHLRDVLNLKFKVNGFKPFQ
jgi:hypothetical protein